MKRKHNEGFTLVELLISMVILAAIVLPTCTSLVLSYRMNAKTEKMMQAQLAVSSAVETLMARGITDEFVEKVSASAEQAGTTEGTCDEFPSIKFILADKGDYYDITVMDEEGMVEVKTSIRDKTTSEGGKTT